MTNIPQYFLRKGTTNYVLVGFSFEREGTSAIDDTPFILSKSNSANVNIGDDVSIGYMDGASFVADFSGDVVSKEEHETSNYTLESYGGRLNRAATFSEIYNDKSPEYIVEHIIDNQVSTLTYSSSTASGITISRFVVRDETPGESIGRLVELLNWQIRTDNDKNFYFEPEGTTTNSNTLIIGTNSFISGVWSESPNSLANSVTFIGGNGIFNTTETFSATASQKIFTTAKKILGNVRVTDNGTETTGGVEGSTTTYDYAIDSDNKTVTFTVGRTSGHSIIINYGYEVPIKVTATNDPSIDANGLFSRKITDSSVLTMSDARKRAKQILNNGNITKNASIEVNYSSDYAVGETVQVIDSFNDIDQQVIINKLTFNYLEGTKIIEVGNSKLNVYDWNKKVDDRLKKLEAAQDNSDTIQKYVVIQENINVTQRSGRLRTRTNTLGNSWIVGSSTNGLVGTNTATQGGGQQVVGADSRVMTIVGVENTSDTFYERFNFNTYIDTSTTTATPDYTNEDTDFTSSEILQSLACYYGSSTITKATLTSDSTTNLTFKLSSDGGSNWETVTSGTIHTFTNTGSDLRYQATASDTATISLIKLTYE